MNRTYKDFASYARTCGSPAHLAIFCRNWATIAASTAGRAAVGTRTPGLVTLALLATVALGLSATAARAQARVVATVTPVGCQPLGGAISLSVTSGKAPYRFAWSNGSEARDLEDLPAGSYRVRVTDADGQLTTQQLTVNTVEAIVVKLKSTGGQLVAQVTGGRAPYRYRWSAIGQGTVLGSDVQLASPSPGAYVCTVTDASGCVATATIRLNAATPKK